MQSSNPPARVDQDIVLKGVVILGSAGEKILISQEGGDQVILNDWPGVATAHPITVRGHVSAVSAEIEGVQGQILCLDNCRLQVPFQSLLPLVLAPVAAVAIVSYGRYLRKRLAQKLTS